MTDLRQFQKDFIRGATAPGVNRAALCLPRGNGKSWLAAHLVTRIMNPDDDLFRPDTESILCAGSIKQARIVFRFARRELEQQGEFSFIDSVNRITIAHPSTNTWLRVIGSNGKTAMGLVDCPWVIADEPGAWELTGGQLLNDAIETAMGKPNSPMRAVYLGTLAPAATGQGHWWHDLVHGGTTEDTAVTFYQGEAETWDKWPTIRRANPLTAVSPEFRRQLLKERDAARGDSRLKARFLSYRLNLPAADESTMLLDVDDWQRSLAREPGARDGRPIFAVDLGGGRAWSACVAIWQSGLIDAVAMAPGIPDLRDQEKRDGVPAGLYEKLSERGALALAHGLRVQPPGDLMDFASSRWGSPEFILCDRFRLNDLLDWNEQHRIPIIPRVTRWSEASEDIRALRKLAKDGPAVGGGRGGNADRGVAGRGTGQER